MLPPIVRTKSRGPWRLNRFRRPVFGWLQLALWLFMAVNPLRLAWAVYVPTAANDPYWLPVNGNDPEPQSGPDLSDDGVGHPQWWDQFQTAVGNGTIFWWGGGNFLIDG